MIKIEHDQHCDGSLQQPSHKIKSRQEKSKLVEEKLIEFHAQPCKKVHRALVHKDQDDDVLICNGRGILPVFIEIKLSQSELLGDEDLAAIRNCYSEVNPDQAGQLRTYCLKGIPWRLHAGDDDFRELNEKAPDLLSKCYSKKDGDYRLLEPAIEESLQDEILRVLRGKALSDFDRYRTSLALDKLDGLSRPAIFHCVAYNDTKHYFFYRKRHEHVPGLMMMETARQAFYAHFYRFSGHTREAVNISIIDFNCNFIDYVNSSHFLKVAVETLSLDVEGASREKLRLRATFTQQSHVVAVIEINSSIVAIKLFKKIRSFKPPSTDMFSLICRDAKASVLLLCNDGVYIEGGISKLSLDTIIIRSAAPKEAMQANVACKFHLITQHSGIVIGEGALDLEDQRALEGEIVIRVTGFCNGSEARLKEFIKMDCFLLEQQCYATE